MNQMKNSIGIATSDANEQSFMVSAPQMGLPKGGGAIRDIGEKFSANPVTGTGSMTVPIVTSPGRAGFGPQLNLSYDSGAGNGPFGLGWHLSLPSITRKTDKGLPRYDDGSELIDDANSLARPVALPLCQPFLHHALHWISHSDACEARQGSRILFRLFGTSVL